LPLAERAEVLRSVADRRDISPQSSATPRGAARLERWRAQRPFNRPEIFARRLELDCLTESELAVLLETQPEAFALDGDRPTWVEHVEQADAVANEIARIAPVPEAADASTLEPIRAFVAPFGTAAMARLYREAVAIADAHPTAPFNPLQAAKSFEPLVVSVLVGRAMKVIVLELNVARVQGILVGASPQERCAHFAELVRAGPLRQQILEEYPVLARSLVTGADYAVQAATEFLRHLTNDSASLAEVFGADAQMGTLARVSGSSGDVHRHGRSVLIAEFSSGTRVVYKPRSLAVDEHFHELIAWMNARGQNPPLRAVRVVTRDDHGWAEYITNSPCGSADVVGRFYDRFGAYLAVLHVLNATDFHYENVIACGEHPVLIDLEALFHPHPDSPDAGEPEWLGWSALQASVLRTGVLPYRVYTNEESRGLDMSAVGGAGGARTPNRVPLLVAGGTDEMRFERDFFELPDSQNRPTLGGRAVDPVAFGERVVDGFTRTYRLLLAHRAELLAPDGPIHRFANDSIRVVLRPTRQYALLLSESHHPDVLRDALERDRLIDRLWVAVPNRPELERIIRWEHADLLAGDVPLFTTRPASRDLFTTHGPRIAGFFQASGLASAVERIEAMSDGDLLRQRWVAQASLVALRPVRHDGAWPMSPGDIGARPHVAVVANDSAHAGDAATAARRVADRLVSLALRHQDRVSWLGLTLVRDRDWVIQPVGADLYGGSVGIALFLAYLDHLQGHDTAREIAHTVVRQASRRMEATLDSYEPSIPLPSGVLGAFGTLGGAVYAFSHIGPLWEDASLLDLAERITASLLASIESDHHLDVVGGLAGFIMASAALDRVRPGASARAAVQAAARVLLARGRRSASGLSWTTEIAASRPLTGMSHGASGMAVALATAGRLLGDDVLLRGAADALRYERSTFDADRRNWPDYRILDDRQPGEAPVMLAWCHGAPGIGLARLATLGIVPDVGIEADLSAALETTARDGFGSNESLCHGDLGNLELLIRARELGHEGGWARTLADQSARLAAKVARGQWECGIPGGVETPGLMMGLAGVGYGLLRVAAPDRIPSLLSLEAPRVASQRAAP
jgi:type 2 lantibiotic biosynthesis protein LanM